MEGLSDDTSLYILFRVPDQHNRRTKIASDTIPENERNVEESTQRNIVAIDSRLQDILRGRGYALPSHAVLAATHPGVLAAYEAIYREMTYERIALSSFEKNFVWLVTIGTLQIPLGGHHVSDFINDGGTPSQIQTAAALAAFVVGATVLDTVEASWSAVTPGLDLASGYAQSVIEIAQAAQPLPVGLLDMALTVASASQRKWSRFALHLTRAKTLGVSDAALAEALTVMILPAGNPGFVQACTQWGKLIEDGAIESSAELRHAFDVLRAH